MSILIGVIGVYFVASAVRDMKEKSRITGSNNYSFNNSCTIYECRRLQPVFVMGYEWKTSYPELQCETVLSPFHWGTLRIDLQHFIVSVLPGFTCFFISIPLLL